MRQRLERLSSQRSADTQDKKPLLAVSSLLLWRISGTNSRIFANQPLSAHFGYVTPIGFRNAIHDAKIGKQDKIVTFLRLLSLEYWLRDVARRGLISVPGNNAEQLKIDWAQSPI